VKRKRKRILPKERLEADKRVIDAIREAFKMKPLYGSEKPWSPTVYIESGREGRMKRYELP
jgi:hypothetical protein